MINYSVIIPFRDCTDFLRIACSSIPNRDDIQVIVIDNASDPIGPEAISDFPNKNILYLTSSPTGGAGCARNIGMDHAKGKYLLFLDADDYFSENAFLYFDKYVDSDYDIIYFNATSVKFPSMNPSNRHKTIDKIVKDYIVSGNEDYLRYKFINPISKMVRKSLVDTYNIKYQEVPAGNDTMFQVIAGHNAKKITAKDEVVYVITEGDSGSSLTRTKSLRNQFSRYKVAIDHYKFMVSIGRPDLVYRLVSFIANAFRDFGLREGIRWIKYAHENQVNLWKTFFVN